MKSSEKIDCEFFLKLKLYKGIGHKKAHDLLRVYSSVKDAYKSLPPQKDIDSLYETELHWIDRYKIHVLNCFDERYPPQLKILPDHPIILYVYGQVEALMGDHIAVVGSRYPTTFALGKARKLGQEFASRDVSVVSGLAIGVDEAVHRGVLSVRGITIAVLGSGIAQAMQERGRKDIIAQIGIRGCVVSEFQMKMIAFRGSFPQRNRIVSALSLRGVVVVEGAKNSGALITAKCAKTQGRPVYAMPSLPDNPKTEGNHFLLRSGALFFERVSDALGLSKFPKQTETLFDSQQNNSSSILLEKKESVVLASFSKEAISLENLFVKVFSKNHLTFSELVGIVTSLELKGLVQCVHGQTFLRV